MAIYIFNIFDDYLFRVNLKRRKILSWVDHNPQCLGFTEPVDYATIPNVQIKIARPPRPGQPNYRPDADPLRIVAALIHEMCHAVF